jgi:hypothetical protein
MVKSKPHHAPKINIIKTTNGTGSAANTAATTRIPMLIRRAAVKLTFIEAGKLKANEKEISHGGVSW